MPSLRAKSHWHQKSAPAKQGNEPPKLILPGQPKSWTQKKGTTVQKQYKFKMEEHRRPLSRLTILLPK